jgi:hypothetical protein
MLLLAGSREFHSGLAETDQKRRKSVIAAES